VTVSPTWNRSADRGSTDKGILLASGAALLLDVPAPEKVHNPAKREGYEVNSICVYPRQMADLWICSETSKQETD
jgi:hypothetical protein